MVRSPSSVKKEITGLKKGPWTSDEDEILTKHINIHGHPNWRALPRLAGLARCGKSCRLRWTNYLQPGIKRGNFTREEEEIIINSHQLLGNRWSAIAAKLPGRTDNEIKNVWHTHLKKKLLNKDDVQLSSYASTTDESYSSSRDSENDFILVDESIFDQSNGVQHHHAHADQGYQTEKYPNHIAPPACNSINSPSLPMSLQRSYSETSYNNYEEVLSPEEFPETDESFWSDLLSSDYDNNLGGSSSIGNFYYPPSYQQPENEIIPLPPVSNNNEVIMESGPQEPPHISSLPDADSNKVYNVSYTVEDGGDVDDFWFDVLFRAGDHILLS